MRAFIGIDFEDELKDKLFKIQSILKKIQRMEAGHLCLIFI
ncbi:hypothetical protein [Schnuerera sp. xch1]|nr:hypothetical protein [Schnuerera sp. xch1]